MLEEFYLVSQKDRNGEWNKLCKSQELWWYDEKDAVEWLKKQPDWFQVCNAVFKITTEFEKIEKVFDGEMSGGIC
jgi:hypothetical protein